MSQDYHQYGTEKFPSHGFHFVRSIDPVRMKKKYFICWFNWMESLILVISLHTPNKQQAISKPCLSLKTHKIHFESFTIYTMYIHTHIHIHIFSHTDTDTYIHAHILLYSRHARYSCRHSNFSCWIKMGRKESIKINEIEFVENLHTLQLTHAMSLFASHKTSVHTHTHRHIRL